MVKVLSSTWMLSATFVSVLWSFVAGKQKYVPIRQAGFRTSDNESWRNVRCFWTTDFFFNKIPYKFIIYNMELIQWNYKDHPRDQQCMLILIHRWSLYTSSITWKGYHWGPVQCGLYKQVVLYTGGLQSRFGCIYFGAQALFLFLELYPVSTVTKYTVHRFFYLAAHRYGCQALTIRNGCLQQR